MFLGITRRTKYSSYFNNCVARRVTCSVIPLTLVREFKEMLNSTGAAPSPATSDRFRAVWRGADDTPNFTMTTGQVNSRSSHNRAVLCKLKKNNVSFFHLNFFSLLSNIRRTRTQLGVLFRSSNYRPSAQEEGATER